MISLKNAGYDEDLRSSTNGFDLTKRILEQEGVQITVLQMAGRTDEALNVLIRYQR